ncbi:hypothetical protein [Methylobacterium tarhaniae]|uniref:hypothetical protein n=1 Tax=Methylobacterium tarhaniae TaxID=1187852 RepID=UPI003CFF69BB
MGHLLGLCQLQRLVPSACRRQCTGLTAGLAVSPPERFETLFDRRDMATADGNTNLVTGAPRTVRVQAIARF